MTADNFIDDNPEILTAIGTIQELQRQGRSEEANSRLSELLTLHPAHPMLHRTRAFMAQQAGDHALTLVSMKEAVRLAPKLFALRIELGQLLATAGELDAAIDEFAKVVEQEPSLTDAWLLLGNTFYRSRRDQEALRALRRACSLDGSRADVLRPLAEAEFAAENFDNALPIFSRLASQMPADVSLRTRIGHCLSKLGSPDEASRYLRDSLHAYPESAELWMIMGLVEEDMGNADSARLAYGNAQRSRPGWADPVGGLLMLLRADSSDEDIHGANTLLCADTVDDKGRAYLHYALGKVFDARGEYETAIRHWDEANRIRRSITGPFDARTLRSRVDEARMGFTTALFAARCPRRTTESRPVFVVGMPRSGTTLVEQIIATHPDAHGCGELTEIVRIAQELTEDPRISWPLGANLLDESAIDYLAARYMSVATRRAPVAARRLVDKQPYNFLQLGLIAMLFPEARVVWCRRDPRDVALSIYSENFALESAFATDFAEIGAVIEMQVEFMRHWQAVLPLRILEICYEDMVADTEVESRKLIEFAGLEWNEDCLLFHKNPRAVQTNSRWQVRQPVHARSIGRWRKYADWIPDMRPGLGDGFGVADKA